MAEDPLSVIDLGGCREEYYPVHCGIREFREDVQQGRIKIGDTAVVVCLLGGAEMCLGRLIAKELEALIRTFKTFAADTRVLLMGPFPNPEDDAATLESFQIIYEALYGRLCEEPMIDYLPLASRFGDARGLNPRLMGPDGVTERGCYIAKREINQVIQDLL